MHENRKKSRKHKIEESYNKNREFIQIQDLNSNSFIKKHQRKQQQEVFKELKGAMSPQTKSFY